MPPKRYRDLARVVAGHRVPLDPDEWATVRTAIATGHERYVATVATDDGATVFVRNRWSDGWVLPGGKARGDETLSAAAARELHEETGVVARIREPLAYVEQTFSHEGDAVTGHLVVFAASATSTDLDTDLGAGPDEIADAAWFHEPPETVDGLPRDLLTRLLEAA